MIQQRFETYEITNLFLRRFFDLQFRSLQSVIKQELKTVAGKKVLDFGSGSTLWGSYFAKRNSYYSLDPNSHANYKSLSEIPKNLKFDIILLIEVLEHLENPTLVLNELKDYLSAHGEIWISVPFAARVHGCPKDYWRWTEDGLKILMKNSGFEIVALKSRGSDIHTLVAKFNFYIFKRLRYLFFLLPISIVLNFLLLMFDQLNLPLDKDDPLGYFFRAKIN